MKKYNKKDRPCGTLCKEGATVIFALRRVILLRSDIMLRIVIFPFGQLKGEYNITETVRFQYNFCLLAKISLQTIVCNITQAAEKEELFFGSYLPFSKNVTHYDTFKPKVSFSLCIEKGRTLLYGVSPLAVFRFLFFRKAYFHRQYICQMRF